MKFSLSLAHHVSSCHSFFHNISAGLQSFIPSTTFLCFCHFFIVIEECKKRRKAGDPSSLALFNSQLLIGHSREATQTQFWSPIPNQQLVFRDRKSLRLQICQYFPTNPTSCCVCFSSTLGLWPACACEWLMSPRSLSELSLTRSSPASTHSRLASDRKMRFTVPQKALLIPLNFRWFILHSTNTERAKLWWKLLSQSIVPKSNGELHYRGRSKRMSRTEIL